MLLRYLLFLILLTAAAAAPFQRRPWQTPAHRLDVDGREMRTDEHEVVKEVLGGPKAARELADREGFEFRGRVLKGKDYYRFSRPWGEADRPHDLRDDGLHFQELVPVKRVKRGSEPPAGPSSHSLTPSGTGRTLHGIPDAGYPQQWHHHGTTIFGSAYRVFLNSSGAWDQGFTGRGQRVTVVDDGLDYRHDDIEPNYDPACSWSATDGGDDPMPRETDRHGTAAAGVAAGARGRPNSMAAGACGVGVAYDAKLCGVQLLPAYRMPTDAEEAQALEAGDIVSCSWGPPDNGETMGYVGPLTQEVLHDRWAAGRVTVWAGGNGAALRDSGNWDGFANSPYTLAVGAIADTGYVASYSEPCACLLVGAPSSGGTAGFNSIYSDYATRTHHNGCTNTFGGTSAAAPMIAGLVAVVRQARPELTVRDVHGVIVQAAQWRLHHEQALIDAQVASGKLATAVPPLLPPREAAGQWTENAAGLWHSDYFGFGLPDAGRAVQIAQEWALLPPEIVAQRSAILTAGDQVVPGGGANSWAIEVPAGAGAGIEALETVELTVDLFFTGGGRLSDLTTITLRHPDGTVSTLARPNRMRRVSGQFRWAFSTEKHRGEGAGGAWLVTVATAGRDNVRVDDLTLTLRGH